MFPQFVCFRYLNISSLGHSEELEVLQGEFGVTVRSRLKAKGGPETSTPSTFSID